MDFLQAVELITPMSEAARNAISAISKEIKVPKNEFLLEEGQICEHLYFVKSGSLRGLTNKDGNIVTYWFSLDGLFATSFGSFISRTPSKEAICSIEDSTLMSIHLVDN